MNVFFKIRLKIYIFYSEICKLLKFVIFPKLVKIEFLMKNKNKHNSKCLRPILMPFSIYISILHSSSKSETNKKRKKSRKIVFPKLVTSVYFQKGLNPQIVENKEIHRNLYLKTKQKQKQNKKKTESETMWVLGFYIWHLSLTTKLSEFIKCNMVILKNCHFLRILESKFRSFWK